jgi:hypothetical protein
VLDPKPRAMADGDAPLYFLGEFIDWTQVNFSRISFFREYTLEGVSII